MKKHISLLHQIGAGENDYSIHEIKTPLVHADASKDNHPIQEAKRITQGNKTVKITIRENETLLVPKDVGEQDHPREQNGTSSTRCWRRRPSKRTGRPLFKNMLVNKTIQENTGSLVLHKLRKTCSTVLF